MRVLLQLATMLALAVDVAGLVMLYWTAQAPIQDAAGRGMANGFLVMLGGAMVAATLLLLFSYWRGSTWLGFLALVVAALPLIPIVLPALL